MLHYSRIIGRLEIPRTASLAEPFILVRSLKQTLFRFGFPVEYHVLVEGSSHKNLVPRFLDPVGDSKIFQTTLSGG